MATDEDDFLGVGEDVQLAVIGVVGVVAVLAGLALPAFEYGALSLGVGAVMLLYVAVRAAMTAVL